MIFITAMQERRVLEESVKGAKHILDNLRAEGRELQARLVEADLNRMLDELQERFYGGKVSK